MVRFGRTSSFTADVGGGGFCVQLMRVLPVASPLEGSILVEGRELPFAGRVAWVRPGEPHLGLPGRMGVHITRVPQDYRHLLDSLGLPEDRASRA
jgi:hypothetical protein